MTWFVLLRSPLVWAACAALMAWLAWGQFQRANAASDALRAAERAQEQLGEFLTAERELTIRLTNSIEELANVPDSEVCVGSGSIRVLPDLLRSQRANP